MHKFPAPRLTVDHLKKANYTHGDNAWFRWFREANGKKRYIIVFEEHNDIPAWIPQHNKLSSHAQFQTEAGEYFDVTCLHNIDSTLSSVEAFYQKVFESMKCRNYE